MQKTVLELTVSEDILVPDTGMSTGLGADATSNFKIVGAVIAIVVIVLTIAAIYSFVRHRKLAKLGFNLKADKTRVLKTYALILTLGVIGGLVANVVEQNNVANASTALEFSTKGTIKLNATVKDEPQIVCATDEVTVARALPAGYAIDMYAGDIEMVENGNIKIETTEVDGVLNANTWGYTLSETLDEESMLSVPAEITPIKTITGATEENNTTKVSYCVNVKANAEPGTYKTDINYAISPEYVTYALSYDANGGVFAEAPATQTSERTYEVSYDFVVTDVVPSLTPEEIAAGSRKTFYGWSTTGDSTSRVYTAGETITVTEPNTVLKAVWGYGNYTITFNKNINAEVSNFVQEQKCILTAEDATSCDVQIIKKVPTTEGFSFLGWSTEAYTQGEHDTIDTARSKVAHKAGDVITLSANLNLYAVWWEVSGSDFQMELRWGELPQDLDSYLVVKKKSDASKVGTVYFSNKRFSIDDGTIELEAELDIDDRSSYGPETLTLSMLPQSAYRDYDFYYYIRNYSREEHGKLKESGANITLIRRGETIKEYNVAEAAGESALYWNVFAIKNGEIVERNTLTADPDINY